MTGQSTSCGCYHKERSREVHKGHAPYVLDPLKRSGHAAAAHQELRKYGSSKVRPRHHLSSTLHNREWLIDTYLNKRYSKSGMSELAGCSAVSVAYALKKFGIQRAETEPEHRPHDIIKRRKTLDVNIDAKYEQHRLARSLVPLGPCVVCGAVGKHLTLSPTCPEAGRGGGIP